MKRISLLLIMAVTSAAAFAQVPRTLSFQGYLTDVDGNPKNEDPGIEMTFSIFDTESGPSTTAPTTGIPHLWLEIVPSVKVVKGLYHVNLGLTTALNLDFDKLYYLEVKVGTETLSPRIRVNSSAYSISGTNAATITDNVLPIEHGGTGGATVDDARSALGLVVGTHVQAYDADLDDLADGVLSGSKVGSGIDAGNITNSLAITNGGTGGTSAAAARTNLGVAIGTNVQAYDADLDDLADGSLSGSKVGSGINASNITSNTLAVGNGGTGASSASAARSNLGLAIGSAVQAYDADLDDLADGSLSGSKVTPAFGSQNVTTTGYVGTTGGIHVGNTTAPTSGNLEVDGYTKLGSETEAPAIKMKKFTGTTPSIEGFDFGVTHSIAQSKILSVQVMIDKDASAADVFVPDGYRVETESEFGWYLTSTQVRVIGGSTTSGNLTSKTYRILIIYEQ